jgi:hypothetical protein
MYIRYRIVNEQDIREGMVQAHAYLASHRLGQKTDKGTGQHNPSSQLPEK